MTGGYKQCGCDLMSACECDLNFKHAPGQRAGQESGTPLDVQVGGDHYKKLGAYQPWEVLRHWLTPEEFRGYMKGTAIAYLAREQEKGGTEDIAKATHTLHGFLHFEDASEERRDRYKLP